MCQNNPMGIELFFHETTFFCFKIDECGLGEKKGGGGGATAFVLIQPIHDIRFW